MAGRHLVGFDSLETKVDYLQARLGLLARQALDPDLPPERRTQLDAAATAILGYLLRLTA